ncbi:uncharacterized protein LOC125218983 [Salvia hispanica]|uniref:uncharacterized protein LOC125218983 n=1 Tax=Salvia hispanica TaxID=49212 RepID=UPI002009492C|nr:uncharacterized protein LOC125218983 [Salvia hispanica]
MEIMEPKRGAETIPVMEIRDRGAFHPPTLEIESHPSSIPDVESAIAGAVATNTPKPGSVPGLSAEICGSYPTGDGRLPTQHGRDKLPVPIPILPIPEQSISA